jgi:hypothetical protein
MPLGIGDCLNMSAPVTNALNRDLVGYVCTVVNHDLAGNKGCIYSRISNGIGAVYVDRKASSALGVTRERKCEYYKRKCTNPKHTAHPANCTLFTNQNVTEFQLTRSIIPTRSSYPGRWVVMVH